MEDTAKELMAVTASRPKRLWPALLLYGVSACLSIAIMTASLQLWQADFRVPFSYTTRTPDAFMNMMYVKMVIETGWTWHNPLLGAPLQLDQLDFPNPQWLTDAVNYVLSWFTRDFGTLLNFSFLLTFPLVALTTTLASRQVGLGACVSILVAQLYTFLPYHFIRGEMHLALSAYYALPLTVPPLIAIASNLPLAGWNRVTGAIGYALTAFSHPYYAVFAGFFLCVAAIRGYTSSRKGSGLRTARLMGGVLAIAFAMELSPNIIYTARFGANPTPINRSTREGDEFGLRLTQMLFPVAGHRISALAALRDDFVHHAPMVNENEASALGAIAAIGLLMLMCRGIFRRPSNAIASCEPREMSATILDQLAVLVLSGIMFATIGGIGPTFNYLGFTTIRAYNRISIFLGLFAILAIGIAVERIAGKFPRHTKRYEAGICLLLLVVGLFDEISPRSVPAYAQEAADFQSDAAFVASIERAVPPGASIFQLPATIYPESAVVNRMPDYQLFRGYLHSSTLHWSYGAMRARAANEWQRGIVAMQMDMFLSEVQAKGFSGVYLDRMGFPDDSTERALQSQLGPPIVSKDLRLVFFPLRVPQSTTTKAFR